MTIHYSFVEYTVAPDTLPTMCSSLVALGFVPRVEHTQSGVTIWTQKQAIIMMKQGEPSCASGISGLGFLADPEDIQKLGAVYEADSNMYVTHDHGGMRVLLACTDNLLSMRDSEHSSYIVVDDRTRDSHTLTSVTGVIYACSDPRMMDFYQDAGFRFTKSGDRYNSLVSSNNRFTIVCDKQADTRTVPTLVCDCTDVFASTSMLKIRGFDLKNYQIDADALCYGKLNHKIVGYNCFATGTENSYSIENMLVQPVENLDIIFRTRKQHLHISEHTLSKHYDDITDSTA